MTRTFAAALAVNLFAACGAAHIAPYVPKHREYKLPAEMTKDEDNKAPGSLWQGGRQASMLFTDARALHRNDTVVVKIEEVADAQRSSNTDLTRNSNMQAQLQFLYNALNKVSANPWNAGLNASLQSNFNGDGQTSRSDKLTATVPATVREVLPNGNLFIEGHRVVLVNAEEHHFYISGVVRPIDIDQDNSVKSSAIADAEIEFTGQGVLTDNQRQGWLSKFMSWIWPF